MMWGYGYSGTMWIWMSLFWLLWIAIAAFIFGIIFWWTRTLIPQRRRNNYKKRNHR